LKNDEIFHQLIDTVKLADLFQDSTGLIEKIKKMDQFNEKSLIKRLIIMLTTGPTRTPQTARVR
jgi:hypothetical protein